MTAEQLNPYVENSLAVDEVADIVDTVRTRRGDLLRGLGKLEEGKGRYVKIFVNAFNPQPNGTIIATARCIADGHTYGDSDVGIYSKDEWLKFGIVEVNNFDAKTVQAAIEQYHEEHSGIKGGIDSQRVGAINMTSPDKNKVSLGEINLEEGTMTWATIDRTMI